MIHSSICGGASGRLGNMLKHSTVWRPQCLSNQNLRFALASKIYNLLNRTFWDEGLVIDVSLCGDAPGPL